MKKIENVAIIGASNNPDRYSYMAMQLLDQHGHQVHLVSPKFTEIEGHICYPKVSDLGHKIDTVTVYVRAEILEKMADEIIALKPRRIIFNPGTEAPQLYAQFNQAGIETEQACTLVLLRTGAF
jgi:uncharacterized protein